MKKRNNKLKTNGFALFISILVASIVLSVSFGVFDIALKELKLSGLGQESQIAFYAADAGIECFLYWEIKHNAFNAVNTINCAGKSVSNNFSKVGNENVSNFTISLSNNSCVKVEVKKSGSATTVVSKGYNMMDCNSTSPFKVERAIQLVASQGI